MYTDPNTTGMSLPAFAVLLAALTGVLAFLSRQVRSRFARIRLPIRDPKQAVIATQDQKPDD